MADALSPLQSPVLSASGDPEHDDHYTLDGHNADGISKSLSIGSLSLEKPLLVEVAWEVANKVGGIYTVIRTKAPVSVQEYGESRYLCLGPYNAAQAMSEVEELPVSTTFAGAAQAIRDKYGIVVHYGRWLVPGNPRCLLFEVNSSRGRLGDFKKRLWEQLQYSSPDNGVDLETDNTIIFGFQVYLFLEELTACLGGRPIIAHFHEWQVGIALPLIRGKGPGAKPLRNVGTVFTTHATLLARYLCAGKVDLYTQLPRLDVGHEAFTRGISHRHNIERMAAQTAHVFTTVSDITAWEAGYILGRKADVVLPNGLQVEKFLVLHEFQNLHKQYKDAISEFVRGHFHSYLDFDLDDTLYFFTAGRYEYLNKGVDVYLDALAKLNRRLKESGSKRTVVNFIIMPAQTNNFNVETLKGQSLVKELKRTVDSVVSQVHTRIFESLSREALPDMDKLLSKEEIVLLKRRILSMKRATLPPVVTHNMVDPDSDQILGHIRRIGLFNNREDRVKVIFHPEFLSLTNPLFGIDYDQFVRGCHLGVFCSLYEPFGYTPAECTVLGVPSVTSDLSGFAGFIARTVKDPEKKGIFIVKRRERSYSEVVDSLAECLWQFTQLNRRERIEMRNKTESMSNLLSWESLYDSYRKAHTMAVETALAEDE